MNNIILIGFKSAGKTTLGKKIAERMNLHFIDTDDLIAKNNREFYLQFGPAAFREIEKEVIRALAEFQNTVIATGGGVILDPENIAILKKLGKLIYLQVEKEELKRRLFIEPLPAILDPENPEASFEKMYQERLRLYEQAADFTVAREEDLWELLGSKNHWQ